jgi:hypothetical protein
VIRLEKFGFSLPKNGFTGMMNLMPGNEYGERKPGCQKVGLVFTRMKENGREELSSF